MKGFSIISVGSISGKGAKVYRGKENGRSRGIFHLLCHGRSRTGRQYITIDRASGFWRFGKGASYKYVYKGSRKEGRIIEWINDYTEKVTCRGKKRPCPCLQEAPKPFSSSPHSRPPLCDIKDCFPPPTESDPPTPSFTSGTILGLPCAHWNGKAQFPSRRTSVEHSSIINSSLNMTALLQARELSMSSRPWDKERVLLVGNDKSLSSSSCFHDARRIRSIRTWGSSLHLSAIAAGNAFTVILHFAFSAGVVRSYTMSRAAKEGANRDKRGCSRPWTSKVSDLRSDIGLAFRSASKPSTRIRSSAACWSMRIRRSAFSPLCGLDGSLTQMRMNFLST